MKKNVVVCGTNYGMAYLSAFLTENSYFKLVGILAKGSARSQQFAKGFGVPIYNKVEEIPSSVDIACIAVRASILGGEGTNIALEFMSRGIHVIQEHPVHPADVRKCFSQARESGVSYHINSHFVNTKPVRMFIDYIQKAIQYEQPLFIESTTSLSYSLIDILGRALGGCKPYGFTKPVEWDSSLIALNKNDVIPFQCLQGIIAGIPISLNFQNFYDPESDIDDSLLILHRICIGMPSGNITLLNTHGPVVWSTGRFLPITREPAKFFDSKKTFGGEGTKSTKPTSISFSNDMSPSLETIMEKHWPNEILLALEKIREQIITGIPCPWQSEEYLVEISQVWMEIARRFGPPHFTSLPLPPSPLPDPLAYREEMLSKKKFF